MDIPYRIIFEDTEHFKLITYFHIARTTLLYVALQHHLVANIYNATNADERNLISLEMYPNHKFYMWL